MKAMIDDGTIQPFTAFGREMAEMHVRGRNGEVTNYNEIKYCPFCSKPIRIERLPEEYEKCLVGLTAILREAWNTSQQTEDNREKIQALSLAKECYSMKLGLLTNATVMEDAIRFNQESQNKLGMSEEEQYKKEPKEPDYTKNNEELEDKQQEETGEIKTTTNQVF